MEEKKKRDEKGNNPFVEGEWRVFFRGKGWVGALVAAFNTTNVSVM